MSVPHRASSSLVSLQKSAAKYFMQFLGSSSAASFLITLQFLHISYVYANPFHIHINTCREGERRCVPWIFILIIYFLIFISYINNHKYKNPDVRDKREEDVVEDIIIIWVDVFMYAQMCYDMDWLVVICIVSHTMRAGVSWRANINS